MIDLKKIAGAPTIMRNKGIKTDSAVLQRIQEEPGTTVHEIADYLDWTNGKVDGSVNRLLKKGRIRVQFYMRKRTLVKKIYPVEKKVRPPNVIEIPKENIDKDIWKNEVFIYSLSRSSIGLSPRKIAQWDERASWKGSATVKDEDEKLVVELPKRLSDFYRLENSEVSLSTSDDFALLTIETTIIPVELPPSHPSVSTLHRIGFFVPTYRIAQITRASEPPDLQFFYGRPIGEQIEIPAVSSSKSETSTLTVKDKKEGDSTTSQRVEIPTQVVIT